MKVQLRDKSGIRLYRFVVEDVDRHGNVRIYFRRKGQPKIRSPRCPARRRSTRNIIGLLTAK